MSRMFKILSLTIGLTAFVLLTIFGFAIWVFLPLLPAAIIFMIALITLKGRTTKHVEESEDTDHRKAA